jgi:hypothetical protein
MENARSYGGVVRAFTFIEPSVTDAPLRPDENNRNTTNPDSSCTPKSGVFQQVDTTLESLL